MKMKKQKNEEEKVEQKGLVKSEIRFTRRFSSDSRLEIFFYTIEAVVRKISSRNLPAKKRKKSQLLLMLSKDIIQKLLMGLVTNKFKHELTPILKTALK